MKILLRREDVAPDSADKSGRTPLSWAAANGYEDIVKILLGRGDVAPNAADKLGQTPLLWAVGNGHEGVVEILFERTDVTPGATDKGGRTHPFWLADGSHLIVAGVLQEPCAPSQDIVMTDLTCQTAAAPTSGSQHGRARKRPFEDQGLVPRDSSSNSSAGLSPAQPSESSQYPSKLRRRF